MVESYVQASNEDVRRKLMLKITETVFKEETHPTVLLARKGIGAFIPNLTITYKPPEMQPDGMPIEYIYTDSNKRYDYYS